MTSRLAQRLLSCLAALQAGCALGPDSSYVAALQQPADARVLAESIAEFVAMRLPSASSTVALDPTPAAQTGNMITPDLVEDLQRRGFAVVESGRPVTPAAHRLRYLVTLLDSGALVRLTLDGGTQGARFFARNTAGDLQSGGPYTVTQAAASP
jgi:hypothetical protein